MSRIKRLEMDEYLRRLHPDYVRSEWDFGNYEFNEVEPLFSSDGHYLVNGRVRYEYKGT